MALIDWFVAMVLMDWSVASIDLFVAMALISRLVMIDQYVAMPMAVKVGWFADAFQIDPFYATLFESDSHRVH